MNDASKLAPSVRWLGYAGLLPQILCVLAVLAGGELQFVAIACGFAYAAAIFSFVGGMWWGQALASGKGGALHYGLAVLPSLLAVALFLPWTFGWEWPGPALLYLGALIVASPLVDRALGMASPNYMRMRVQLSLGLGTLTIVLGILALRIV